MSEELSLSLLNAKITKLEATLTACDDALMCVMEVVSDFEPEYRPLLLDKLMDAIEAAQANDRPDVAKELAVIRASFRSA